MMRITLLLLMLMSGGAFAQGVASGYAVVDDADGHANLRAEAGAQAKVLARIPNGTPLSCSMAQSTHPKFCFVQLEGQEGFMHLSRLVFLDQSHALIKIPQRQQTQQSAVYQAGNITVAIKLVPVALNQKLFATRLNRQGVAQTTYQGQVFYGTDNERIDAAYGYAEVQVRMDEQTAHVPQSQLIGLMVPTYAVEEGSVFDYVSVYHHPQQQRLYVFSTQADGAAMYTTVFEFRKGVFVRRQLWLAAS